MVLGQDSHLVDRQVYLNLREQKHLVASQQPLTELDSATRCRRRRPHRHPTSPWRSTIRQVDVVIDEAPGAVFEASLTRP